MWTHTATERRRTADLLDTLTEGQLDTQSLCDAWRVRDVAGHINFIWSYTDEQLMERVTAHGGQWAPAAAELGIEKGAEPVSALSEGLREHADLQRLPPGARPIDVLADIVVHTYDMVLPLGLDHPANPEATRLILEEMVGDRRDHYNPPGGIDGLRYEADDLDWAWGDGPVVRGAAIDLASALHGRPTPVDRLVGDGVETFRQRFVPQDA